MAVLQNNQLAKELRVIFPSLSIVMVTHGRPRLLERALRSLRAQSNQEFQIVLVADETNTASLTLATKYLAEMDSVLTIPGRKGPAESRNYGAKLACGKWVCFLDDDDAYEPSYVDEVYKILSFSDHVFYFNYRKVLEHRMLDSEEVVSDEYHDLSNTRIEHLEIGNFIPVNALVLPTHVANQSRFDPSLRSHEDWDWLISIYRRTPCKHIPIYGPIVYSHIDGGRNNSSALSRTQGLDYLTIYRKWPVADSHKKAQRLTILKNLGINIPEALL